MAGRLACSSALQSRVWLLAATRARGGAARRVGGGEARGAGLCCAESNTHRPRASSGGEQTARCDNAMWREQARHRTHQSTAAITVPDKSAAVTIRMAWQAPAGRVWHAAGHARACGGVPARGAPPRRRPRSSAAGSAPTASGSPETRSSAPHHPGAATRTLMKPRPAAKILRCTGGCAIR